MAHAQFQTVHDLADRMMVSEAPVRGWIKGGALRAVGFGRVWRIADTDLDLYLRRHASRPGEATSETGGSDGGTETRRQSGA